MSQQRPEGRTVFFVLMFVMAAIINGCGHHPTQPVLQLALGGAPQEVVLWEEVIQEFEENTGIKVHFLRQPTDTDQRRQGLLISLKARQKNPDVFLMDVAWVAQFAASGWLEPLNHRLERSTIQLDDFFRPILESVDQYAGKIIALPVYIDGGLLYYRKDLLKTYGYRSPPETWQELIQMALTVQESERSRNPNFYGFVWQGAQYEGLICNFLEFAASNGGGIAIQGSEIRIHSPENREALQFMHDLIHRYHISPPNTYTEMKEETVRRYFQNQNALFERNWPYAWALHQAKDSPVQGKVGIAVLPHFSGGRSVSTLGGWHVGISVYSDLKDQAWRLLEFIVSPTTQKKLALKLGWSPGRKDIYDDPELHQRMPHLGKLKKAFENAVARPAVPYYSQISETLQQVFNAILSGELAVDRGLLQAEKEVQKIVQRYEA